MRLQLAMEATRGLESGSTCLSGVPLPTTRMGGTKTERAVAVYGSLVSSMSKASMRWPIHGTRFQLPCAVTNSLPSKEVGKACSVPPGV